MSFDIASLDDNKLNQFRNMTDPLADDLISEIIQKDQEDKINDIFLTLVRSNQITDTTFTHFGDDLSKILNQYFSTSSELPPWTDTIRIANGEKVFALYGPEIFMLLNMSSLPLCYSCAKGAQVLYDTGRLLTHGGDVDPLARRLMETAQMVVNVLTPGGLSSNGSGLITIQKVRLIHASIRYYLKSKSKTPWDAEYYGEPINQEDLAGTLMSFGPVILSGLKQLGVELTEEQIGDYLHVWKVVGYLMGIKEDLLPDTYQEAFGLASKILEGQAAESEAGKALTASCVDFVQSMIPGHAFDDVPNFMIHTFLKEFSDSSGRDLSKCIGINIKNDHRDKIVFSLSKIIVEKLTHLENHYFIRKIAPKFNKLLLKSIIKHYNSGKKVHFSIPPSLTKNWDID